MRRFLRAGVAAGLGLAAVLASTNGTVAADKAPDWTGFVTVSDVIGEVVKADEKGLTLRVTWYVTQGGSNRRPPLSANSRNFRSPSRSGSRPQVKEMHHDYELEYVAQSLVRHKAMPPKLDEKGKKVPYTDKEREDIRQPIGVPGYVAGRADVTTGSIVEVILIRDKAISAAKATEDDLRLKYVYLLGHDTKSPAPSPDAKSAAKKN